MTSRLVGFSVIAIALLLAGCVAYPQQAAPASYELQVAQARATAEAEAVAATVAQQERDAMMLAMQLTATQASFDRGLTMTAISQSLVATQAQATQQAQAQATQQALSWQSQQTQAAATQVAAAVQAARRERQERTDAVLDPIRAAAPLVVGVVAMALFVLGMVRLWPAVERMLRVWERRSSTIINPAGEIVTYLAGDDDVTVIAPTRQVTPAVVVRAGVARSEAGAEAQWQDAHNRRGQTVALAHTLRHSLGAGGRVPQVMLRGALQQPTPAAALAAGEERPLPEMAPWDALSQWRGNTLPLGIGKGGGWVRYDPAHTPHLLVAGTSGSGKTMSGLRPIAAQALAAGWQVIALNIAGGDFAPLTTHSNLLVVDGGAERVAAVLGEVAEEVNRRSAVLARAGVSTWSRLPAEQQGPRMMVIVDELVALTTAASPAIGSAIWRALILITSQGRKMGISMVLASTDPTYRTLGREGLIVRDNCARVTFRVRDSSTSRAVLDEAGAEALARNQFLAQLAGAPELGVAFHPQDDDLRRYLAGRSVQPLAWPEWVDVPTTPEAPLPVYAPAGEEAEIISLAEAIRDVWARGGSKRACARAVNREYGGGFASKIDRAVAYLGTTTTTTATTTTATIATGGTDAI